MHGNVLIYGPCLYSIKVCADVELSACTTRSHTISTTFPTTHTRRAIMPSTTNQKRVTFELTDYGDVRTYRYESPYVRSELIDESLWWSAGEFGFIRSSAMLLTSKVRNGDDEDELTTYRRNSYRKSLSKAYRLSVKSADLPRNAREDLEFWVNLGDSRRGLEKFILEDMRRDRDKRRDKLVGAVRTAQDRCKERGCPSGQKAEMLRNVSEGSSRHAKRFARVMAIADEYAANLEKYTTPGMEKDAPKAPSKPVTESKLSWRRRLYNPAA
mmetsp:Transcript_21907/g.37265  ORF Transcript_21907/g.37265 Transcript_21907/m.37265 type:complete len:270 (-) Transcript_21907:562-1371(-)